MMMMQFYCELYFEFFRNSKSKSRAWTLEIFVKTLFGVLSFFSSCQSINSPISLRLSRLCYPVDKSFRTEQWAIEHGYLIRICIGIWGGTDQGLYSTCRRCPEYSSQASPGGKIQLVPRLGCVFRGPVNDLLSYLGYLSRQVAGGRERRGVLLVW